MNDEGSARPRMGEIDQRKLLTRIAGIFREKDWRDDSGEALELARRARDAEKISAKNLAAKVSGTFLARNDISREQVRTALQRLESEIFVPSSTDASAHRRLPTTSETDRKGSQSGVSKVLDWLESHPIIRALSLLGAVAGGLGALLLVGQSMWPDSAPTRDSDRQALVQKIPTPENLVHQPYEPMGRESGGTRPSALDGSGSWAKVSFRDLGLKECEPGGSAFPCYLPLRSLPDYRDEVGVPVTEGWPVDRRDWVWVECRAEGNGVPNQGLLRNNQGVESNLWYLIRLGEDDGVRKYAWGNAIWLAFEDALDIQSCAEEF